MSPREKTEREELARGHIKLASTLEVLTKSIPGCEAKVGQQNRIACIPTHNIF
jgi:hypothetical protein